MRAYRKVVAAALLATLAACGGSNGPGPGGFPYPPSDPNMPPPPPPG